MAPRKGSPRRKSNAKKPKGGSASKRGAAPSKKRAAPPRSASRSRRLPETRIDPAERRRAVRAAQERAAAKERAKMERWGAVERRLRISGVPAKDRKKAHVYFLRREGLPGGDGPRPAPASKKWRDNATYRLHRGYFFKDPRGRWRTPDGTRQASGTTAKRHNAKHNARLVREDAYLGLLARGAPIRRKAFHKAVPAKKGRERRAVADAVLKSKLIEKSLTRAHRLEARRVDKRLKAERKRAKREGRRAPIRRDVEAGFGGASLGGDERDYPLDEEREALRREEGDERDAFEREYDDIFEDWFDDYEGDGGDTP